MLERILLILKTRNISASQFADEINVQRSSISHILSGRNNPSLELVMKIVKKYPEIDLEWLMMGKGQMIRSERPLAEVLPTVPDLFSNEALPNQIQQLELVKEEVQLPEKQKHELMEAQIENQETVIKKTYRIEKIIVFNSDKTFIEFFARD